MMWVLLLNDMRSSNIENIRPVVKAGTKEQLKAFIESQKVDHYSDGQWGKTYRKDGPLEWFNPPWEFEENRHFRNVGTAQDWANAAIEDWNEQVGMIPEASQIAA